MLVLKLGKCTGTEMQYIAEALNGGGLALPIEHHFLVFFPAIDLLAALCC